MSTVLVTGASRGIGKATCLALGRAGHRVIAAMRDPRRSPELAAAAASASLPIVTWAMDVDADHSVRDGVKTIEAEHGPIDALVNNAGIERHGSIEEVPLAAFRAVMETNYFGAIRCIQAVIPGMRARRRGCIVNVSSIAGRICSAPLGPYAASKFALEAISEALAQEVRSHGIRVAVVEPGIIGTDMAQAIASGDESSIYPHTHRYADVFSASLKRPTSPELVADTIRAIVDGDSARFRHPVGRDAEKLLAWRASLTDDAFIDWHAADDDTWYANMGEAFGLKQRKPR
jgi:NAD(P)-dependent dehydrogenase (short-subunit alcohol dehydrogenase family)